MTDAATQLRLSQVIQHRIQLMCEKWSDVEFVYLSTTDGFHLYGFTQNTENAEPDKVAAIASSLFALSNTAAHNILDDQLMISIVETSSGNILFLRTQLNRVDTVLTIAANKDMSLAKVRYHAMQLSELIEQGSD